MNSFRVPCQGDSSLRFDIRFFNPRCEEDATPRCIIGNRDVRDRILCLLEFNGHGRVDRVRRVGSKVKVQSEQEYEREITMLYVS